MGEGAGCAQNPDVEPARPRRHHPADLHLRHHGRAEGRDAFGQYADGEHHSLCGTSEARKGRYRSDGLALGPPDRLHVRPDDADHAAGERHPAGRLGSGQGDRDHPPGRRHLHDGVHSFSDRSHARGVGDRQGRAESEDLPVRRRADSGTAGRAGPRHARRQDRFGLGHDGKRRGHPDQARRRRQPRLHDRRLRAARRRGQGRRRRRQAPAARRDRPARGSLLFELRRLSEAPAMERHGRRGLVRHRRSRPHRRQRLYPHQRPQQGRHHQRRREHTGRRDRGAPVQAPRRRPGRHCRLPRWNGWASVPAPSSFRKQARPSTLRP